jgi:CubicO group peptidase (beta-lactamase class C family)
VSIPTPPPGHPSEILRDLETWPVPHVAACVISGQDQPPQIIVSYGDVERSFRLASITKMVTAYAILVAVEEGVVDFDSPVDIAPPGATLRHLLSHAAGYPFDGDTPVDAVGVSRIYSNTGIEVAAKWLELNSGFVFGDYLREAVLTPLEMTSSEFLGSPAHGLDATVADLAKFAAELLSPRLISPTTLAEATQTQYPHLDGIVPGMGRYTPCPWGLGMEIAGTKAPHWMGRERSPATFGHFGGAGTMMWVDPKARISFIALTDLSFDRWAATATREWAQISDKVLTAMRDR